MRLITMKSWKPVLLTALVAGVGVAALLHGAPALAYAPEGDLMKTKGYSPEVIQLAQTQRSRQEWKMSAAPKMTPTERFFHNVYYGDWTGDVDQFGSMILREQ